MRPACVQKVTKMIRVALSEDYSFSTARNYTDLETELDVIILDLF